jgi:predicted nuclease of restriction endonuclease-like RecB superfamily
MQTSSVLKLDSQSGLSSRACVGREFDSKVEQAFYEEWKAAPETAPWQLLREAELLHDGQFVFFPDFVFQHPDGRRVLLEIVGFWTPEYLEHKQWVLSRFRNERIILAVARTNRSAFPVSDFHQILEYKTKLSVRDVLTALQYNGRRTSHLERADRHVAFSHPRA